MIKTLTIPSHIACAVPCTSARRQVKCADEVQPCLICLRKDGRLCQSAKLVVFSVWQLTT